MDLLYTFFNFSARIKYMNLRESVLPSGWYPRNPDDISRFLSGVGPGFKKGKALAAIAPHAGWYYSGRIAAQAVASLDAGQTIVIIGGHLPAGAPALFALEDAVDTPFGPVPIDNALRTMIMNELDTREDRYQDNTVEVLVPMVRFFFPDAAIVWMRLPAENSSFDAGALIARSAQKLGYRVRVLASADLTHYGDNYDFSPAGRGKQALKWVMEVNDARFIEAVTQNKPETVIRRAEGERSCCSAGSVAGAMGFANAMGASSARLLEYTTSAAQSNEYPDSFVGYAALSFN
jgi:AmmeMemoRadiSam system protein B